MPALRKSNPFATPKLSHALRRAQLRGEAVSLTTYAVDAILARDLPRPSEQSDLLVRWIAEHVKGPGETLSVEPRAHSAIIGASSPKGFALVVEHLIETGIAKGFMSQGIGDTGRAQVTLSMRGWEYYEALRKGQLDQRRAFMAMKFGDAQLDLVVETVFKPAVRATGFELRRLNDEPRAGLIDDRLRVEIQSSDFLIADLTHENAGAYWEAGYAEGLRKPVIYTCEQEKFDRAKTHFDTNHHLTVTWSASALEDAAARLKATVRATFPDIALQYDE